MHSNMVISDYDSPLWTFFFLWDRNVSISKQDVVNDNALPCERQNTNTRTNMLHLPLLSAACSFSRSLNVAQLSPNAWPALYLLPRVRILHNLSGASSYFDLETPAPMTPGSFSSPTLNNRPMDPATRPTRMTVVLAISQKGELTSIFWQ